MKVRVRFVIFDPGGCNKIISSKSLIVWSKASHVVWLILNQASMYVWIQDILEEAGSMYKTGRSLLDYI